MKKAVFAVLVLTAVFLTACAGKKTENGSAVMLLESSTWPENQYTDNLPVPPGDIRWVMMNEEEDGYCAASLTGLTEEDFQNYMACLYEEGFSVTEEVSETVCGENHVSTGALLSNGEKNLSIAFMSENLTIYISLS